MCFSRVPHILPTHYPSQHTIDVQYEEELLICTLIFVVFDALNKRVSVMLVM